MGVTKSPGIGKDSDFHRAYLEGIITNAADREQAEETIAEAKAAASLRCYFNKNTDARWYVAELTKRFSILENYVLTPVELQNTRQIASVHLLVRNQSIELLEEVLNTIPVSSEVFPLVDSEPV